MIHNNYKKLYLAFNLNHELIGMCQSEETLIEKKIKMFLNILFTILTKMMTILI